MIDLRKVLDAIGALVAAIPGVVDTRTHINIHGCTHEALTALEEHGAIIERCTDGKHATWETAELRVGDVLLCAFGPHSPLVAGRLDDAKVEAALARAQEALS